MKTQTDSFDTRLLKWGSASLVAFLVGSFLSIAHVPVTSSVQDAQSLDRGPQATPVALVLAPKV